MRCKIRIKEVKGRKKESQTLVCVTSSGQNSLSRSSKELSTSHSRLQEQHPTAVNGRSVLKSSEAMAIKTHSVQGKEIPPTTKKLLNVVLGREFLPSATRTGMQGRQQGSPSNQILACILNP